MSWIWIWRSFFDRVNHDKLMSEVSKRVNDRRLLALIRRFLKGGVLDHDALHETVEGTPQGGPLSPLLSNLLLDELDRELERRGHRFARYADDCNIYVRSLRAGRRVLASITRYLSCKLRLKVIEAKSEGSEDRGSESSFALASAGVGLGSVLARRRRSASRLRSGRSRGVPVVGASGRWPASCVHICLAGRTISAKARFHPASRSWIPGFGGGCAATFGSNGVAVAIESSANGASAENSRGTLPNRLMAHGG